MTRIGETIFIQGGPPNLTDSMLNKIFFIVDDIISKDLERQVASSFVHRLLQEFVNKLTRLFVKKKLKVTLKTYVKRKISRESNALTSKVLRNNITHD